MQKQFGNLYLVVDVPLMELFLRRDGVNVMHMRVVVGKPERQTPSLFATMANVVINPPWGVPPTILKNDVLPGVQKDGKNYLNKKGIKVYDRRGNIVKASSINAGNYKRFNYKQDPGDDNSLGYVKFNLPNPWDIYLHDTPHRTDFVKNYRALSSGCIRVQQPQEMAVYILSEIEKKYFTIGKLDTIISTEKTRWEVLKTKIPVHIAYLTAFEDTTGKHIQFTRDIYHRDDKLISLLN
jgi:murein L,D-transpeptidase YcbB/YkuD